MVLLRTAPDGGSVRLCDPCSLSVRTQKLDVHCWLTALVGAGRSVRQKFQAYKGTVQGIIYFNVFKKKKSRCSSLTLTSSLLSSSGGWILSSPHWERVRQLLLCLPGNLLCVWFGSQLMIIFLLDGLIWAPTVMMKASKEEMGIRSASSLNVFFS